MHSLVSEIHIVRNMFLRYGAVFAIVFVGALTLTPKTFIISGWHLSLLTVGSPSLAVKFFLSAKSALIPAGIPIVTLGPVAPFVAPFVMAFLIAVLLTFPVGLYLIIKFLYPALRPGERKTLLTFITPSLTLFYAGCALAYFLIIPKTFAILYAFAAPMEVAPFFALDNFISSVFFLTVSVGFAFLLPIFMVVLTRIDIIPARFWTGHWRGAVACVVIFSAVVTPDGSGVTMVLLSVPLIGLYMTGAVVAMPRGRHTVS
jgi:sec-independent protein translocase protein TatC